ncbi:cell division protein FtsQ/DivIB [Pseudoxanthomonas sp. SL93]|jgi:cell division protein FtsQ|uniref:cell division protein FtsQ/DivIB n=1 Tax=Pseudoxanthomonas sp. SL93 TaxID=2995142 RepID=UPI00227057BD|nr:cell division protein FtsQ/DivIB [Pseudoxanthomonas sp. SL93]WAC61768.1 cell division protein FtsQ/DivIB [Pseudoxanthomonas sp. SL93]
MNAALRIVTWLIAIALVALPVVAVVNGWIGAERWPLTRLRVQGEFARVDAAQLRQVVLPYAQRGFFAVRLSDAQKAVEKLPWVERAEVRKRWPDVMEIRIVEHKPFARWGQDRLLSEHGRLFPMPKELRTLKLPQLGGPDSQVQEVTALYNESRQLFAPMGLDVHTLVMDRRGSWSLQLGNGTEVVVGRADARPRLGRFARMLPQLLANQAQPLERADLRYTNGFALSWGRAQTGQQDGGNAEGGALPPGQPASAPALPAPATQQGNT